MQFVQSSMCGSRGYPYGRLGINIYKPMLDLPKYCESVVQAGGSKRKARSWMNEDNESEKDENESEMKKAKTNKGYSNFKEPVLMNSEEFEFMKLQLLQSLYPSVKIHEKKEENTMISYAGSSLAGSGSSKKTKINQDCLLMMEDKLTDSLVIACLDGHGPYGEKVSEFVKKELENLLFKHNKFHTDLHCALREVISTIEKNLFTEVGSYADFSGTTLAMAIVRKRRITVVNIGDSRIVLGMKRSNEVLINNLTVDHKPQRAEEYSRIISSGGRVFSVKYKDGSVGPPRVWLNSKNIPGLAMSRSIGDFVVQAAGVISTPDIYDLVLKEEDLSSKLVIIVATDGLWDHVESDEAINDVVKCMKPCEAVQKLLSKSRKRWEEKDDNVDDITIGIAFIGDN